MEHYSHKICDPIHGFIRLTSSEKALVETVAFQRLRYLNQMGMAYLVYPGATHTRFEHSLGVMELASRIYRQLKPDCEEEVLRLVALCHDLGHLPFSHTAELELLGEEGHEEMTIEIVKQLEIPHKEKVLAALHKEGVAAQIIMDDNFGADRIDYLLRDATYTGVRFGHLDANHLIESLKIMDGEIGIHISGIQSVESLWIARYMMFSRVCHHPKVRIFSTQMAKFMDRYYKEVGFPETIEDYLQQKDFTILAAMERENHPLLRGQTDGEEPMRVPQKAQDRDFPVIDDQGCVRRSFEVSPFLCVIPHTAQT
ncbi:MAG: Deoxyguanosinetriphosphate triphosphohydrolase-like protein [Chlamydiales bacterium]|nr:Deoxyguanosinetriphosphate triphosphohydrolase-like protein [Chlamydiales bacterium]MCH9636082.1 Deoxyguanosinetriphosphate triphosphohydrolase-like protein [Chlamydiales bacterium]MCH9704479.1 HD domain-containing protein [Chlamydiota bacterium]